MRRLLAAWLIAVALLSGAGAQAPATLTLTWTDNASNEDGFYVERRPSNGYPFQRIATPGVDAQTWVDTTVLAGESWCYRVQAWNTVGTSAYTNEACAVAQASGGTVPLGVTGVQVQRRTLMAVAFDAKMTGGNSSDGLNQEASAATSISSTGITVGAGASLLVMVIVYQTANGPNLDTGSRTATWDGVAMTERATVSVYKAAALNYDRVSIWTLVNPAAGAKTLAATWANTADAYMSAVSFTGTDTTTGVQTSDSTTATNTTSITVTSDANGATVAVFGVDGSTPTVNFTKIFAEAPLNPGGGASYTLGGTSNVHTFTGAGGTVQALAGVHVIAAAGEAAGAFPFTPSRLPRAVLVR